MDWGNRLMSCFSLIFFFLKLAGELCIIALIEEETTPTRTPLNNGLYSRLLELKDRPDLVTLVTQVRGCDERAP